MASVLGACQLHDGGILKLIYFPSSPNHFLLILVVLILVHSHTRHRRIQRFKEKKVVKSSDLQLKKLDLWLQEITRAQTLPIH